MWALSGGCAGINATRYPGRIVVDRFDGQSGRHHGMAERDDIEPFVRRALEGPVIQIEPVDIDPRPHPHRPRNAKGRSRVSESDLWARGTPWVSDRIYLDI